MLDFYARRSPIFMAARFDASRAKRLGQNTGDGTPIMVTMKTDRPWVPLRILSLGSRRPDRAGRRVSCLTDTKPNLLAGGRGLSLDRNESANALLLSDLPPTSTWVGFPRTCGSRSCGFDVARATSTTTRNQYRARRGALPHRRGSDRGARPVRSSTAADARCGRSQRRWRGHRDVRVTGLSAGVAAPRGSARMKHVARARAGDRARNRNRGGVRISDAKRADASTVLGPDS